MIFSIIKIVIGVVLVLFLPGVLYINLFFKNLKVLEKLLLGFGLSVFFDVILALFLGINPLMKNITGGITQLNVFIYLMSISTILAVLNIFKIQKNSN